MSAEHFQTFLSCDMRTAPNGRDVEYAESDSMEPRHFVVIDGRVAFNPNIERGSGVRAWSSCYLYAENALEIVAQTIESDPMSGSSGDHPEKREHLAAIVRAVANATRTLALDAACDSCLDDKRWAEALIEIINTADKTREPA